MNARSLARVAFGVLVATASLAAADKKWTAPRTADGQPDLQGVWNYSTLTPFERPTSLAGKEFFKSAEEGKAWLKEEIGRRDKDRRDNEGDPEADVDRAYNAFWWDFGEALISTGRTSLVIDPPDGKVPALMSSSKKIQAAAAERRKLHPSDGPEDRNLGERCIAFLGRTGPPMAPSSYNNNVQIFQAKDTVATLNEQVHDVRIIPLDGRSHISSNIRQWLGNSRGHWEGETLVVETTNFTDKTRWRGSSEHMQLVERFTRTAPNTLIYEFTITDPESFEKPWTAQVPMVKSNDKIYEYACHEGNYGLVNLLTGARSLEKKGEAAARKKSE
jgi:hypothetical protein